jgi:hypothetical protein
MLQECKKATQTKTDANAMQIKLNPNITLLFSPLPPLSPSHPTISSPKSTKAYSVESNRPGS